MVLAGGMLAGGAGLARETIDVSGTCWDGVGGLREPYSGRIYRWRVPETGQFAVYGFVTGMVAATSRASSTAGFGGLPMISFIGVGGDTMHSRLLLHGTDERGGSEATCEVSVTRRDRDVVEDQPN